MDLAKKIQSNLNDAIQKENKRVAMKLDTVYIMKHVEIPISIVECGISFKSRRGATIVR